MPFTKDEIQANRDYFLQKLHAEKQRNAVLKAVEAGSFDFILLDTRGTDAFTKGHIPGAWNAPAEEMTQLMSILPKDKEIVTYCWGHD